MRPADVALFALVMGGLPLLAVVQARALEDGPPDGVSRSGMYLSSALAQLSVVALIWLVSVRRTGWAALGLSGYGWGSAAAWGAVLVAAALAVVFGARWIGAARGLRETPFLRDFLPMTPGEYVAFTALSMVAGFAEEIVFRGYALRQVEAVAGTAAAVVATSAVFGVLHAYQGVLGMLRTGLMGAVLAVGTVASGSLWPAIVAHVALNPILGGLLRERAMVPEPETGV